MTEHPSKAIVARFLLKGNWRDALDVLELLPDDVRNSGVFSWAWQFAKDQEEHAQLEESVYPAEYPLVLRWRMPPELAQAENLTRWYPSRVLSCDASEVKLILATVESDMAQRSVYERIVPATEWHSLTGISAQEATGYWFIAANTNGQLILQRMEHQSEKSYFNQLLARLDYVENAELLRADSEAEMAGPDT